MGSSTSGAAIAVGITDMTSFQSGSTVYYDVPTRNLGPQEATGVRVTIDLALQSQFVSATPDHGSCFPGPVPWSVHTSPDVVWQPSLLASSEPPAIDESFSTLTRIELDDTAWVDHAPGWLAGSDELFADLVAKLPWQQRSRHMYDKVVAEPRLTALWRATSGEPLEPPVLEEMRAALSRRYGVELDSAGFNLYRDGRDSVAWHGDRIDKQIAEPIVAIVSLGDPRPFLLRPKGGGASRKLLLGRGDLLVTGGACQRSWQHAVPKVALAGPRISVSFRHGLDPTRYR